MNKNHVFIFFPQLGSLPYTFFFPLLELVFLFESHLQYDFP